jgi:cytoskeletal protein CcmA (bactofilin family)
MAIFSKSDDKKQTSLASPPTIEQDRSPRPKNVLVIGSTLVIKGELSAAEDLIIEGQIEGTIAHHKKHLTVGEQGRVKADIHASSVIVLGQLVGDIYSEGMVSLGKSAQVEGNIVCTSLVVEDGAKLIGNVDMGEPSKVSAEKVSAQKVFAPKVSVTKESADAEGVLDEKPGKAAGHTAKASVY